MVSSSPGQPSSPVERNPIFPRFAATKLSKIILGTKWLGSQIASNRHAWKRAPNIERMAHFTGFKHPRWPPWKRKKRSRSDSSFRSFFDDFLVAAAFRPRIVADVLRCSPLFFLPRFRLSILPVIVYAKMSRKISEKF